MDDNLEAEGELSDAELRSGLKEIDGEEDPDDLRPTQKCWKLSIPFGDD